VKGSEETNAENTLKKHGFLFFFIGSNKDHSIPLLFARFGLKIHTKQNSRGIEMVANVQMFTFEHKLGIVVIGSFNETEKTHFRSCTVFFLFPLSEKLIRT
jgi:hypothetical protein